MSIDYSITTFVNAVKALCDERDINLGELEAKCGLSRGFLSRVLSGKSNLKITSVIEIANAFELYIDDIFFFDFDAHRIAELKLKKEKLEEELEMVNAELENK